MEEKRKPRCHNCKFAGNQFKIDKLTHLHYRTTRTKMDKAKQLIEEELNDRGLIFGIAPDNEGVIKVKDVVDFIHNREVNSVIQQHELLLAYEEYTSYKVLGKKTDRISKQMVEDFLANNCA